MLFTKKSLADLPRKAREGEKVKIEKKRRKIVFFFFAFFAFSLFETTEICLGPTKMGIWKFLWEEAFRKKGKSNFASPPPEKYSSYATVSVVEVKQVISYTRSCGG